MNYAAIFMSAFILGDPYEVHWPFLLTVFLVLLLDWLISAWLLYRIGKRLRYEKSWNAWFPLYNTWMLIKLALKRHPAIWLASLLLLNFCMSFARDSHRWSAGYVAWLACLASATVITIFLWTSLCKRCGKPGWWGILWIIPVIDYIVMYQLAKAEEPAGPDNLTPACPGPA
jgi:hypothetical protein